MTNDIDTLATALYVKTDDLLKQYPDLAPWRPKTGLQPRLSDAELVTLAVMQALLGYTSEARWVRYAHGHLGHLFRYLPGQPGYNRRLRAAAGLITTLTRLLAADTSLWTDDVWVIDSTPVECGRSRDTARRSDLAGWAEYGYCASHSRYFWGLRLHLLCTLHGLPAGFALTGAKSALVLGDCWSPYLCNFPGDWCASPYPVDPIEATGFCRAGRCVRTRDRIAVIPRTSNVVVGQDIGVRPGNMDLMVSNDFPDEATYQAWGDDRAHARVRAELLHPIARCLFYI